MTAEWWLKSWSSTRPALNHLYRKGGAHSCQGVVKSLVTPCKGRTRISAIGMNVPGPSLTPPVGRHWGTCYSLAGVEVQAPHPA